MRLHHLLIVVPLLQVPAAWAISPEAQEYIALQKTFAAEQCGKVRDYLEMVIAGSYSGGAAHMQVIEKRNRVPRSPERQALDKRSNELGKFKPSPEDSQAIIEASGKLQARCPWGKEGIPMPLPPIPDEATAKEAVLAYVPRTLMKLRQCEIFYPESRGVVEKAWTSSVFSKLAIPELQPPVDEVRAWLKDGMGEPLPGSMVERQKKSANEQEMRIQACKVPEVDLKRFEAALPAGFVAKYQKK